MTPAPSQPYECAGCGAPMRASRRSRSLWSRGMKVGPLREVWSRRPSDVLKRGRSDHVGRGHDIRRVVCTARTKLPSATAA